MATMATAPSQTDIYYVMNSCSCSKREAIELLKRSGNDPQQAQQRHQMRLQFGWSPSARTFRLSPAPDTPRVSSRSGDRKKNNDDGPDHDEYDIITPQTDREVFSKRTDQSQSGPFSHQSSMLPTRPLPLGGSNANNSTDGSKVILKGNANSDYAPPKTQSSQPWHQFSEADSKLNNFGDSWRYRPNADDGLAGSESSRQQREKADANSTGPDDSWRQGLGVDTKPNDFYDPLHINVPDGKDVTTVAHDQHRTNEDMPKEQLQDHSEEQAGGQQSRQETTLISTPGPENQEADIVVQSPGKREWDFILPEVTSTGRTGLGRGVQRFDIREVVALIQGKSDERTVEMYFENYDKHIIQSCIKQDVEGFPSIFYAAATNNDRILRSWIANGADVNAVHEDSGTPLLAFVIINSEHIEEDTTDIVATLLSTGASPLAIAESFYKPYNQDLPEDGPSDEDLELCGSRQTTWLHSTAKRKLASNLNLTHRYNLERASRTPKPSVRQKQVAERNKAEGLLGLPYFLIGQSLAANRLLQTCINHLADRKERPKPLVIVFAGPSGHGKTELARRLGYLMSLELEVVDCTIVTREMELFGGRHPYVNAGEGTPINNFLARNSGQRCIVFMDEFEKTTKEIHQALLLPFDNGEYQDRRNLKKIDCSKTIWILATNALDRRIRDFCKVNEAVLFDDDEVENKTRLMKELDRDLKNDFLAKFDAPITGRISAFLPFLLFSPSEQAVIAHKYLLELGRDVRRPVNLATGDEERLIGNVRLHIRRDASICSHIAKDGYFPDLGARSLITTVDGVRNLLVDAYLEVDEAIREAEELVDFVIDIRRDTIFAEMYS